MKVLFVTMTAGQGHNSACAAVSEYIGARGAECMTVDILKSLSPLAAKAFEKANNGLIRYSPFSYELFYGFYEKADKEDYQPSPIYILGALVSEPLRKAIEDFKPDYIVCSHVFCALALTYLKRRKKINCPIIGIVTDFTIHPFWDEAVVDILVTASPQLNYSCNAKGIEAEIYPVGIPVREKFLEDIPKRRARKMLGLTNQPVLMIISGSTGYGNLLQTVQALDKLPYDMQIVVICGNNKTAYNRIRKLDIKKPLHCYGYIDNIDIYMSAADILVTKPGGITASEAIVKRLPMVLINPIPGQEVRNMQFLVNNGMAVYYDDEMPLDEKTARLITEPSHLDCIRHNMEVLGKRDGVKKIGDLILNKLY
ncbi:MAG TPA: glycosyltransferase [Clostridia bacterium]|nr:glycosyltransferase [Clostridia bacterium]